jgi:hypothetical protein
VLKALKRGVSAMASTYIGRYRMLPTDHKMLLIVVNQECGFGTAAELCNHLIGMQFDQTDDKFWDNVESHARGRIIDLAKSRGIKQLGAYSLMQLA